MCFELDSVPPIPPIEGGAVDHSDLELESEDGNRFAAFAALHDEPSDTGVEILPDVRGLYRFYEELALRFRRARARGDRIRLLRAHGRRGEEGRRLRLPAPRRARHSRPGADGPPRRHRLASGARRD